MPPSLGAALRLGLRATLREAWLLPVGALVALARRAALWPALAVLVVMLAEAALRAARGRPFDATAPIEGALAALGSPRLLALVAGLALAGALLGGALRVAWLAGALPTLAGAMSGAAPAPRFAEGVAFRFPRVLGAALLALAADLAAGLFALVLAAAAVRVSVHEIASGGSPLVAAAVALALVLAVSVPLAVGALGDAAVARAAVRDDRPAAAFGEGARRLLAAPGSFLLAAMADAAAGALAPAAVEGFGAVLTGFARGVDPLVLVGPNLMITFAALLVAAALDLWWLGTVAVLACGEDRPLPAA